MEDTAAHFFFQIVSERYEKDGMILTSKSYGGWEARFRDSILTTVILDRLLYHASKFNFIQQKSPTSVSGEINAYWYSIQ
ncbi:ATP-binding protein [Siminovitchia terrae]|nr:ATP-binding protein [Siminovitchia terrae]